MFLGLIMSELNAQELNDELKKRLRQSIHTPETRPQIHPLRPETQVLPEQQKEVLKVSPFTRLPTPGDRIKTLHTLEQYKAQTRVSISTTVTNSRPINELPPGSVRYEFVGKNFMMIPTGGTRVVPSGRDSGPIRKRHKKNKNILKAFEK